MKVLITLPVKVGFDGMTKQVLSYSQYMDRKNVEIDLLSCRGFDVKMTKEVDQACFNNIFRLEYRDTNQKKYFFELLKLIKQRKYDVIHANGQSATLAIEMLAGKLGGCKLRVAHSHNSSCQHMKVHKLLLPLFKITYNDAIACSKEAGDWLFGKHRYWILKNGVNIDKFSFNPDIRKEIREELKIGQTDIAVGNVAAFEPKKNHIFLIDLFENLSRNNNNFKLFLWGIDGTTKDIILQEIKKRRLQNNIFYMGTTDHIQDYIQAMDIMLLPSLYEGFPVTVVEWQASGIPCIVSDTITKDVNINGLVKQLPINKGIKLWEKEIIKIVNRYNYIDRMNPIWKKRLMVKGYDIKTNANELKAHYLSKLAKSNR